MALAVAVEAVKVAEKVRVQEEGIQEAVVKAEVKAVARAAVEVVEAVVVEVEAVAAEA